MELDIIAIVQEFAVLPVAGACVLLGWLLKNVWENFPNKYIPLALLPVAIIGVLWLNAWEVTPGNLMAGLSSAALAVYMHQNIKQLFADKEVIVEHEVIEN